MESNPTEEFERWGTRKSGGVLTLSHERSHKPKALMMIVPREDRIEIEIQGSEPVEIATIELSRAQAFALHQLLIGWMVDYRTL